jgi:hypothetical protein
MIINLNNKTFTSLNNSTNGEVSDETVFNYYQKDNIIWADYSGGTILKGSLIGKVLNHEEIEFNYQHISSCGDLKAGHCKSKVIAQDCGRIKLKEEWQWFTGDQSKGYSELIEKLESLKD